MNVQMLLSSLAPLGEFLHWHQRLRTIDGWLYDLEAYALFLLAAQGPGLGEIVEIGSYLGRSTAWLAAGSKTAGREKVTAVDHFKGSPEHQAGQQFESKILLEEKSTYHRFLHNLRQAELDDHVSPIVGNSEETAATWSKPVRLLFIDGDHAYQSARRDFESWARFVISTGLICFHDVNVWPGVTQFYQELMQHAAGYREVASVVCTKVVQKQ
ncbi:MAG: class I SAM-dependent methyltransferase [Gemmataceae bacterium]|nr:class I SAM-dependent methyltransferase [Gemmataceae bacterium]